MNSPSPSLQQHQSALKVIYAMTTAEEFDYIPEMLKWPEYNLLTEKQHETLSLIGERQRAIHLKSPAPVAKPIPAPRVEELKEEFKAVDEEQFKDAGPEEVDLTEWEIGIGVGSLWTPPTSTTNVVTDQTTPTPVEAVVTTASTEEEPKTRKRRTKEEMITEWAPRSNKSYTLHRVVKVPIDGVQFSNNECGASVTSDNLEDAKAELTSIMEDFLSSSNLIFKVTSDARVKDAYAKWLAEWKAVVEKVVTAPVQFEPTPSTQPLLTEDNKKDLLRYARLKTLINHVYTNLTPGAKAEMTALKEAFEKTNPPIQ